MTFRTGIDTGEPVFDYNIKSEKQTVETLDSDQKTEEIEKSSFAS